MKTIKVLVWVVVLLSLPAAYWVGKKLSSTNTQELIQESFKDYVVVSVDKNKRLYRLYSDKDTLLLKVDESVGYGGRMIVGTASDETGTIRQVELIYDIETRSYINKMKKKAFFRQFNYKLTGQALEIGYDIDAVSGATISSKAITKAVRNSSHYMTKNLFGEEPEKLPRSFKIASYEWGIFTFFILSIVLTFWLKKREYKIISYALSILLLGFFWNASFSISFVSRLFMGEIPSLTDGLLYWIFMLFIFGGILIFRKNLYCNSICPFFAVQYFFTKLSGRKWNLHPKIRKYAQPINGFLLWLVLVIALVKNNSTISSYEPFSMMFSLKGNGVQWFVFPAVLMGSMFVSQFFCKFFCPIGALTDYALKARKGKLFKTKGAVSCAATKTIPREMNIQYIIVTFLYLLSLLAVLYYLVTVIISTN